MLVNRSIPNLYQGISQQPPTVRLPTQAAVQENAFSSIVEGLKKRPPTVHVAKLTGSTYSDAFVHTINRDATEQYVVVIINGDLKVYNIAGTEMTVNFPNGKGYLAAATPSSSFSCVTIADYTFIVNKTIVTAMTASTAGGTNKGTKQAFTNLPTTGMSVGDVWEIAGDNGNNFDNYYVKWDGSAWRETILPGLTYEIDAAKMPWKLVRTGTNTFSFDKATWTNRIVGDNTSNQIPSFIGYTISDIFFHRNRLGLLSDENVIMSRAGDFFNFWSETALSVIDSDPIDVAVTSNTVSLLKHAISFNSNLLLFSDNAQFQLTTPSNIALSPKSVTVNATTKYQTDNLAKPVGIGQDVYFTVSRGDYSAVMEYFVQPMTYQSDAVDVTAHVPKYVPSGVYKLVGSSINDVLFALSHNSPNEIYTYKYFWTEDNKKVQESWSVWKLATGDTILGGEMLLNRLYLVVQRTDGVFLEYMDIQPGVQDTNMGVQVHLDRKVALTGVYAAGVTTWTLPYVYSGTVQAVMAATWGTSKGTILTVSRPTTTTVTATGDYSAHSVYIGVPYTMTYRFSDFNIRDEDKTVISQYQIKLKYLDVVYANSGYFSVSVTPYSRSTYTYHQNGTTLGTTAVLGTIALGSGSSRIPLMCGNEGLVVELKNDSYLPCFLQSAEWNAKMSYQFKRV